ncbi:diguanylate cyclase [Actinotalea sp. BY-33]|uniref:Diguanylate cyclase n=1 Tax=Actinotalea soli TaxID=2819234 RepID=A0A939RTQ8_9CELL|nr:tetratricopeptide repeat-containing diguanylate cyclase [Actinotalea soli]MBO1751599.1 diguanylate cyclase [Actinotalea soli]
MSAVNEEDVVTTDVLAPDWADLEEELAFLCDSDAHRCAATATAALARARALGDEDAEMRVSYYLAVAHHLLSQDAPALEAAARTVELAEAHEDLVWQSRALSVRGLVHHELGDLEDAVDLLTRAVELRRESGDAAGTAEVLNSLGTVYTATTRFAPEAAQVLTQARHLWLSSGDADRASIAQTNLARTSVAMSARLAATNPRGAKAAARNALRIAQQAIEEADAAGLSRTGVDARIAAAGAHLVAGDLDRAESVIAATGEMLDRFPSPRQQLMLHRVRSQWFVRAGRWDEAVLEACDGLDLGEELDRPAERVELLRTLVEAHEGRGDLEGALRILHELHDHTVSQHEAVAERRAVLLSSRMEVERAERMAETERRRAAALEEHNARLAHEANHDALTGLANRRALDQTLEAWVAERTQAFAVALIDIDHFKLVNDTWSHQVGDDVLARTAGVLRQAVRSHDLAARYGGEEFAILLATPDVRAAADACERIRGAVEALTWDSMPGHRLTISVGLTVSTEHCTPEHLLARADAALYEAKTTGRNRVRVTSPDRVVL